MYESREFIDKGGSQHSQKYRLAKLLLVIVFILFSFNTLSNIFIYQTAGTQFLYISPLAKDIVKKTVNIINSLENSEKIKEIVDKTVSEKNNYGIVVKNFSTGERYFLNERKIFDTASLYKLWVMAVTFDQISKGNLKKTDIVRNDIKILDKRINATESSDMNEGEIVWPVQNALEQMIMISDNYSAMLLADRVGLSKVSEFLKNNNFWDSRLGTLNDGPKTSALDTALFFDKLYYKNLINSESSKEMLNLLKKQRLNNKIPKFLPDKIEIAHKTGELNGISHDAGIVYGAKSDYIIVILSLSDNTIDADNTISKLSKDIYDYFNN